MADTEALRLLLLAQLQQQPAQGTTPRSPSLQATQQQSAAVLDSNFINSSDFRIWAFKILPCTRRYGHDWTACPFCHPGEKATRRCPQKHTYCPLACPDVKKTGECPRKDACTYAHNVFEFWCHPLRFRTQLCSYGAECKRSICFFAHCYSELRVVDQSLLQELERQMDLMGEGAGFGFPPASKRSGREERYGSMMMGDNAPSYSPGQTPRRTVEEGLPQAPSQRHTTAMSEARAAAERALPDGVPQSTGGDLHRSDASSPFRSVDGLADVDGQAGGSAPAPGSSGTPPATPPRQPAGETTPPSTGPSSLEPSMAALQALQQMQAAHQRQQQPQQQQQAVERSSYSQDKVQAAAAILGLDASYLGRVLREAAPPPPPPAPAPATSGVQAAMQALMQQLTSGAGGLTGPSNPNILANMAGGGGGGGGPSMPSLGGWVGARAAPEATHHQNTMAAMLLSMADNGAGAGGGGGGGGSLRSPLESLQHGIHGMPSLRANEEQMANTLKVLMELNGGNRNASGNTPRGNAAAASVQSVVQQLQELSSLRQPVPEPEPVAPASVLAAALASMQQNIDAARLSQALNSLTAPPPPMPTYNTGAGAGGDASQALMSALLSQLSVGNNGGGMQQHHQQPPQQHHQQHQLQPTSSMGLSDMGMGAFSGATAAAIAAAAAAQAAGTHLTTAAQAHAAAQQQQMYGNNNNNGASGLYSHQAGGNGAAGGGGSSSQGASSHNGGGTGKSSHNGGGSSQSPVDVLSMRSARSGRAGSGTESFAGSDGSGSPPLSHANATAAAVEVSESVEEEDLAAHPELLGAHRLLGTLSELVGGTSSSTTSTGLLAVPVPSAAATSAAVGNHPLRGSPSLRPGAVVFSPTPLGISMSSPLLGLQDLQLDTSFLQVAGTTGARPNCEGRLFSGVVAAVAAAAARFEQRGEGVAEQQAGAEVPQRAPVAEAGAVALLTPAGTGSFSAHDFPAEL